MKKRKEYGSLRVRKSDKEDFERLCSLKGVKQIELFSEFIKNMKGSLNDGK